jgi:hypothetical protein
VKFSREFIALGLQFARRVERVNKIPLAEALLRFTPLYLAFGLERDFDPAHPIWRAYVAGLGAGRDLVEWTDGFYSDRQAAVADASTCAARLFGCFSYAVWPEGRVRLHFRPADPLGRPLSRERAAARRAELAEMFRHLRDERPAACTVVGGSWLYNIDAYRRLFPPEYLATAKAGDAEYQFLAQWGQFLDCHGHLKAPVAQAFLHRLARVTTAEDLPHCFPYPVLRLESSVAPFYELYGIA